MALGTDDLVIRAELRSTIADTARDDRRALADLGDAAGKIEKPARGAAAGLTATEAAAGKAARTTRTTRDAASEAARAMGHAQDAQGRWRDSTGRFLSVQERANAGLRNSNDSLGKFAKGADGAERAGGRLSRMLGVIKGPAGQLAGVLGAAFGGAAIVGQIRETIGVASDLNESVNALNVTYGDASAGVQELGRQAARSLGLSNVEFNGLAVRFSAFTQTIAGEGGDVVGTLDALTGRASDFASVMNLEVADAAQLFQSGLAGETEPLRAFGIDLSAASVEAYALREGIAASAGSMTEAQKVQARYGLLMESTAKTAGDFANTSDQLANRQRIVGARIEDLRARIGAGLLPVMESAVGVVGDRLLPAVEGLVTGFTDGTGAGGRIRDVLGEVRDGAVAVAGGVRDAVGWLNQNRDVVVAVASGLTAAAVGWGAYTVAMKVAATWTKITTTATALLNGTMRLNPVGLVVTALALLVGALVYAYQNSETFRAVVTRAWDGIKAAALAVVGWFMGTAVPWLQTAWAAIAAGASWLWNNVLSPVWEAIKVGFTAVVAALSWAWENVLKPVFTAVGAVASWLWNTVLAVAFLAIRAGWALLSGAFKLYWDNVLQPVFRAVAKVASWLWETVLSPIFGWIGDNWETILAAMKVVWETQLRPAFNNFGDVIKGLRDTFSTAVEGIKTIWNTLRDAAKVPIDFIVKTVINEGIIGGFNKVADLFQAKTIDPIPWPPKGWADGGYTGPGSKYQLAGAVHAGEFVTRKESTERLERDHPGLLDHLNRWGSLPGRMAAAVGYAVGGFVRPVNGPLTSPYGMRWGKLHAGQDFGVPIGTPVKAAASGRVVRSAFHSSWGNHVKVDHGNGLATNYAHFVRRGVPAGTIVRQGQQIGSSGNTGNSTGPHLHFEVYVGGRRVNPSRYLSGAGDAGSGGNYGSAEGGGGLLERVLAPFTRVTDQLRDKVLDNPFGSLAVGMAKKGLGVAKDFITGKVASIGDFIGNAVDGLKGALGIGTAPKGVERWRGTVEDALRILGLPSSLADTTLRRMNQESSGNPRAVNTWDSNARQGVDMRSKGLMQVIGPTFRANAHPGYGKDIFDPLSNILASMRYALKRYGSLPAAYNRKGGYSGGGKALSRLADAGVVLRDRGGPLEHGQLALNLSGQREEVLAPSVSRDLRRELDAGSLGRGVHIERVVIDARGSSWSQADLDRMETEVRAMLRRAAADDRERGIRP